MEKNSSLKNKFKDLKDFIRYLRVNNMSWWEIIWDYFLCGWFLDLVKTIKGKNEK